MSPLIKIALCVALYLAACTDVYGQQFLECPNGRCPLLARVNPLRTYQTLAKVTSVDACPSGNTWCRCGASCMCGSACDCGTALKTELEAHHVNRPFLGKHPRAKWRPFKALRNRSRRRGGCG
jgi:hypothetical protein